MKKTSKFLSLSALLLILAGCSSVTNYPPVSGEGFWQVHGIFFLICMVLVPRITILVATPAPIGLLSWFGWAFMPRLLAAILATHYYWDTNPVLCVIAWIVALAVTAKTSLKTAIEVSRYLS